MSPPSFDLDAQNNPEFAPADFETSPEAQAPNESSVAPPQYRKQGFSIYTVMLISSFVCLLTAMIFMFIESGKY